VPKVRPPDNPYAAPLWREGVQGHIAPDQIMIGLNWQCAIIDDE
jgi:hypothetical protein